LLGWIRLTHPFPSVLDGLVCSAIALLAGGGPGLATRIGVAMTLLQLGIGTVNDVVDAPRDAGRKPGKPIPTGLASIAAARLVASVCFLAGTALAVGVSTTLGLLAALVIGIGLAYDLRLKGTAWSWLPFAIGIPILPVFGWVGVTGTLPQPFLVLVPAAVVAGAALAIGNALVDVERDLAAGVSSIAVAFGPARTWRVGILLFAAIWMAAVGSVIAAGGAAVAILGMAVVGSIPILASILSRTAQSAVRERAWQAEAIGLAVLAALWLAAVLGAQPAGQ
jgi:4-hydroxybenzoate polyprenyltransferase